MRGVDTLAPAGLTMLRAAAQYTGLALALFAGGFTFGARAQPMVIQALDVAASNVTLHWESPYDRHIVERTPRLTEPFQLAPPVVETNAWQGVETADGAFYRLRRVRVLFAENGTLQGVVRDQLAADASKISPTTEVYDVEMPFLTRLAAVSAGITNLSGMEYAVSITNLYLSLNAVSGWTSLMGLTQLETLDLGYTALADLTPLSALTNLQRLYVDHNALTNVNGLEQLRRLQVLLAQQNALAEITALAGATNLAQLSLADNQLVSLAPLAGLRALTILDLANNAGITNIAPLLDNAAAGGLGAGDNVYLYSNTNIPPDQIAALTNFQVSVWGP